MSSNKRRKGNTDESSMEGKDEGSGKAKRNGATGSPAKEKRGTNTCKHNFDTCLKI
jgi:hypothetical protein